MSGISKPSPPNWPAELTAAAAILHQAARFADELRCSRWNFAVEAAEFHRLGVTNNGLRLLICHGLVEHAEELVTSQPADRTFQPTAKLAIVPRSCFILTTGGRDAAERLLCTSFHQSSTGAPPGHEAASPIPAGSENQGESVESKPTNGTSTPSASAAELHDHSTSGCNGSATEPRSQSVSERFNHLKPVWDDELYRLSFGDLIVKEYRTPAPNQQLILAAFQEEGWPARIDDPLPPAPDLDPKRRLHETIISLNRNQRNHVLKFCGDGHGEGVRWETAHSCISTAR